MLECRNVNGTGKEFVLRNINMQLEPGYLYGIAGKNGAGKTTLFHYLLGPKKKYEGEICLDQKEIFEEHESFLQQVGFVSDENVFLMKTLASEQAEMLALLYEHFDMEIFRRAMGRMQVRTSLFLENMSRGEFLKFQLAAAMAHHARLYLLDEVTGGMDPVYRRDFFHMLREILKEEQAVILMTTHIQEELDTRMDYVGIMEEGRLTWRA